MSKDKPCRVSKLSIYIDPEHAAEDTHSALVSLATHIDSQVKEYIRGALRHGSVTVTVDITAEKGNTCESTR